MGQTYSKEKIFGMPYTNTFTPPKFAIFFEEQ